MNIEQVHQELLVMSRKYEAVTTSLSLAIAYATHAICGFGAALYPLTWIIQDVHPALNAPVRW